jgi:hypothetical protein
MKKVKSSVEWLHFPFFLKKSGGGIACLLFIVCWLPVRSQPEAGFRLIQTIGIEAVDFTTDKLQNVYLLEADNEVVKYNPAGSEEFRYSNKTLGGKAFIDATNPFQVLLFFSEYGMVLTLDRTLSLAGRIDLQRLGFFRVFAVGRSSDNHLWVYDEANFRLRKISSDGQVLVESNDLSLSLGRAIHPLSLQEQEQLVFLNDPESGVLIFDVFGRYLKTLDFRGIDHFQVFGEKMIFCRAGKWEVFHLNALLLQPLKVPEDALTGRKMRLENDRLYVLGDKDLKIYNF